MVTTGNLRSSWLDRDERGNRKILSAECSEILIGEAMRRFNNIIHRLEVSPQQRAGMVLFGPAVFFISLALLTYLAPGLILAVVAALFMFFGVTLGYLAWKFLQFKKKFEGMARDFEGRIIVQNNSVRQPRETIIIDDSEKIIFH